MSPKLFAILIILFSVNLVCSQKNYSKNRDICDTLRKNNIKCEHNETVIVQVENFHILLSVKLSENFAELKCYQQREINSKLLANFTKINLASVNKLSIIGCTLGDSSFMKTFIDKLGLKNVKEIYFELKLIKDLTNAAEIFEGLENVNDLKLKTFKNHFFKSDSFKKLENVTTFSLNVFNVLEPEIPPDLFNNIMKLSSLSIISSTTHKNAVVKNFKLLMNEKVNLRNFTLQGIKSPLALQLKLPKMVFKVEIINNEIPKIGENEFKRNDQIVTMILSRNNIQEIHPRAFMRLENVEKIDLSFNKLSIITEEVFMHTTDLEELDLSNNNFETLGFKIFASLSNLKKLTLDNNKLKDLLFTNSFYGLTGMEILSLQFNQLNKFQQEMPSCKLKELDLSNNNISKFFPANFISNLNSENVTIRVANNPLETIDFNKVDEIMLSTSLRLKIDVGDSQLKCTCQTITFYEFLNRKTFNDSNLYERIEIFPDDVKCAPTKERSQVLVRQMDTENMLCSLDNEHRNLCPANCLCHKKEKVLTIMCRQIHEIPVLPPYSALKDLVTSIILDVETNNISSLPSKSRETYNHVTEIKVTKNSIKELNENNFPDALNFLDLKHNALKTIAPEVLSRFESMQTVQLSGNPWNCSESKKLIYFVLNNRHIVKDFNHIKCAGGKFFLEFDFEFKEGPLIILFIEIIALSISCGTAIYFYMKYQKEVTEWIFVNDKCHMVEKTRDIFMRKQFDICFVATSYDQMMVKFIADRLQKAPDLFKCAYVTRNWLADEPIPANAMNIFKRSKRVAIILSEFFMEDNWNEWRYSNIYTRIIFIEKGSCYSGYIKLANKMTLTFNDQWFWEKLKFIIKHRHELRIDYNENEINIELQPLNV